MGTQPRPVATRGRARARFLTLVAVLAVASVVACQPVKEAAPPPPSPAPGPSATHCVATPPASAATYQAAFDGLVAAGTGGWVASDGGIPVPLPDGRVLWLFGDTLIGTRAPNGAVGGFLGIANNGFVLQNGRCFTPITEPIPDPGPNRWIWPTGAVVEGSSLRVFGLHVHRTGPGDFEFEVEEVDVATFSLPNLSRQSVSALQVPKRVSTPRPNYGESISVVDDGTQKWVYAYGETRRPMEEDPRFAVANHYVARVPLGRTLVGPWSFWHDDPLDGVAGGWVANANDATPMLFDEDPENALDEPALDPDEAPVAALAVEQLSGVSYLGSAFRFDVVSRTIDTWDAPTPQGPWTRRAVPATDISFSVQGDGRFAYGGRVIFDVLGGPIAAWSVNHLSFDAILANPNLYKVWFAPPQPGSIP